MDYKEKRKYWEVLHSTRTINKDIELLRNRAPKSRALDSVDRLKNKAPGRLEKEILWALLDVCSPEEIKNNRKTKVTRSKKKTTKTKKAVAKKTTSKKTSVKKVVKEEKPTTANNTANNSVSKTESKILPVQGQTEEDKKKSNEGSGVSGDKLEQS